MEPENSQEMRLLGQPDPAEKPLKPGHREPAIQRAGAGAGLAGLLAICAALILLDHEASLTNGAFALISLGVGGLVVSAVERLNRYGRALNRYTYEQSEHASASCDGISALAGRVVDRLNDITESVGQLDERVQGDIGRIGVALDEIASHLPENQRIHNWRGFDEGYRDKYAEQTGTDGVKRGRTHLGVVPLPEPPTDRE